MIKWNKSKIGDQVSNTAIQHENYVIAKFVTYINGERVERYLLSDVSTYPHKSLKWFDDSQSAKDYTERLINGKFNEN